MNAWKEMMMQLPYSETLNIEYLGRLLDKTTECYKFFWFKAILEKVNEGRNILSYEELVDEMICSGWYMVNEYHLNLGPADTLEDVIQLIHARYPYLTSSAKKEDIITCLKNTDDTEIIKMKRKLTRYVPYRLQIPFLPDMNEKKLPTGEKDQMNLFNQQDRLLYYFEKLNGLSTCIRVNTDWSTYICSNYEIIHGWLEFKMIQYLQKRNPSVPGISEKLYPPMERNLSEVKKLWKVILSFQPVYEIYNDQLLDVKDLSIDHFVPWSYVAHDELWNLSPTTRSINSSKSNSLPDWDIYFKGLAYQEFMTYQLLQGNETVHRAFDNCARTNINNKDIKNRIYIPGKTEQQFINELEGVLLPVYESALNCGFKKWTYHQ